MTHNPINPQPTSNEQTDDDAWNAVLSDPENQKTLAELVKDIKQDAASGVFGAPEITPDPSGAP